MESKAILHKVMLVMVPLVFLLVLAIGAVRIFDAYMPDHAFGTRPQALYEIKSPDGRHFAVCNWEQEWDVGIYTVNIESRRHSLSEGKMQVYCRVTHPTDSHTPEMKWVSNRIIAVDDYKIDIFNEHTWLKLDNR